MTEARGQREQPWHTTDERIAQLEGRVDALVQAVHALIDGVERDPTEEPDQEREHERAVRGARLARELLLAKGL